jgi:hypothetical protein
VSRTVLLALVASVLWLAVTAHYFVWPPSASPERVDAVVSLGGIRFLEIPSGIP